MAINQYMANPPMIDAIPGILELKAWARDTVPLPFPMPADEGELQYHRLQVEWLIHQHAPYINGLAHVLDIGAEWRRPYLPQVTAVNHKTYVVPYGGQDMASDAPFPLDLQATITRLPFESGSIDSVICTETLEHVPNLFQAVAELRRVVKSGGYLFISAPFNWPDHSNGDFGDYWRFTRQAWHFLFAGCQYTEVVQLRLSGDGMVGFVDMAEAEGMDVQRGYPTGHFVIVRR